MSLFKVGDPFGVIAANKIRKFWASTTPPDDPEIDEIYLDISSSPAWLKKWNGSFWEKLMEMSGEEILSRLKDVDGPGSGLDADKLDGQDSTFFSPSTHNHDGTYVKLTDYEDADVLNKIKNVDGPGSGLDADKLDGQEGSYYRDASNLNAGTVSRARLGALWRDTNSNLSTYPFIQSGYKTGINSTGVTITFDYAYVNTPRVVAVSTSRNIIVGITNITTTGFTTQVLKYDGSGASGNIYWIAIGRKT